MLIIFHINIIIITTYMFIKFDKVIKYKMKVIKFIKFIKVYTREGVFMLAVGDLFLGRPTGEGITSKREIPPQVYPSRGDAVRFPERAIRANAGMVPRRAGRGRREVSISMFPGRTGSLTWIRRDPRF